MVIIVRTMVGAYIWISTVRDYEAPPSIIRMRMKVRKITLS